MSPLTGNRILCWDGLPIATLSAGEIHFHQDLDPGDEWQAQKALARGDKLGFADLEAAPAILAPAG